MKKENTANISLMTHIVLGYPSFEENLEVVVLMEQCGVSYIELQLPFSDPVADGPSMMLANTRSLERGISIRACMKEAKKIAQSVNIPLLFMTYVNIAFQYGVERFVTDASKAGIKGIIIPDLPFEESLEYVEACKNCKIDPIFVVSPNTNTKRLQAIATLASGMVYCTTRTGVTGVQTSLPKDVQQYLRHVGSVVKVPLAVGFGIANQQHVSALQGYADYAVIGSAVMDLVHAGKTKKDRLLSIADFLHTVSPT